MLLNFLKPFLKTIDDGSWELIPVFLINIKKVLEHFEGSARCRLSLFVQEWGSSLKVGVNVSEETRSFNTTEERFSALILTGLLQVDHGTATWYDRGIRL